MSLSLGIDIGTSGIRTAVLDEAGAVLSMARAGHRAQDPEWIDAILWWEAVCDCLRVQAAALRDLGRDMAEIGRVAVDGTSGSMVLTDGDLVPVGRALMYNSGGFDAEAARIADHAPDVHITRGSGSALGRAMRLVSEDSEGRARYLLHQADFVTARLMGRGGLSDHNNALKTGFDPESGRWPDWVNRVIDPALLPDSWEVGAVLGEVAGDVAPDLGLTAGVVVHAGTTDSIAAFLAAAPLEQGVAVTSLGSTLAVKLLSPIRIDDPSIGLYAHRLRDVWLVGGASNTGGAVLASFFDPEALAALSARIDPSVETGLDYYPLLQPGERFPVNDPALAPRLTPRPVQDEVFLQGMLEGIARIEARCYREIAARGGGYPDRVFSAGGAAGNAVLGQMRARMLGVPLADADETEAAVGAARCALMGG